MIMKHLLKKMMGNCLLIQLRRPKRISSFDTPVEKIVRILNMNGKVAVEYQSSVLVKDVLVNFNGFGVGILEGSSRILPPDYELKTGNVYHLLPNPQPLIKTGSQLCGEVKQIKVIITKQQLQELLSKRGSIEDMIAKVSKGLFDQEHNDVDHVSTPRSWRPELETIPEGRE
ncbi:uncharacterized protein LOC113344166 [Papaver somniferum]|uniref:uncharacterized protein LOC113344166 n=1 Tax=Papaver somniferum TaxID=3469 RepID=UPI000E7014F6|nr:uncharacterized protein LOC113344166 [Papaver somniferum]